MLLFNIGLQNEYAQDDFILSLLKVSARDDDHQFASQKWLLDSLPKRLIFSRVYGDLLLESVDTKKVLDVGGGYTSLTRLMVKNCDYFLLDIMAHDPHSLLEKIQDSLNQNFWINCDWQDFEATTYFDLVIANDLFPNVDQRLDLFLQKFLPIAGEIRLSLTYFNTPRWYKVKRIDADEIFHIMAWNGEQVKCALEKYIDQVQNPQLELLFQSPPSLFANGRQVCFVSLKGEYARSSKYGAS